MNINYDYYKVFYYVAKYKNLSLVAKLINSSQPSLSKLMKKLEDQLGCTLLIRTNRGIHLTPEGERLYSHVTVAYNELRAAEADLSAENNLAKGIICIATTSAADQLFITDFVTAFQIEYPSINFFISRCENSNAIKDLANGVIDFAIVETPLPFKLEFKQTPLTFYRDKLVVATGSRYSQNNVIHVDELGSVPFIGISSFLSREIYYTELFARFGIEWNPRIGVSQSGQILPLVKKGVGIGFIPDFVANPLITKGLLVELQIENIKRLPKRTIMLLEDRNQHTSIAARKLIMRIKKSFEENTLNKC